MFLDSYLHGMESCSESIKKFSQHASTFNANYIYWRDTLFERVMRLFVWENTDNTNPLMPKEIEQRLLIAGHTGITKINGESELTAMFGHFHGVTKYHDEFSAYNVHCPIYSGTRAIGKDVVVINNNSLRNPTIDLVHHYAIMLAHVEVTLLNCLINARDSGGVPIASTEKQKQSIQSYQSKLYNGQYSVVSDIGMLGIEYAGADRGTKQDIASIMETRENILKSFYSDIGVRSAYEKRNNTVIAEVEADTSLLLLNLSDMLDCRKKGAEAVNNLFGTNWDVHIAKEIDYATENERVKFDNNTDIHVEEIGDESENG